MLEGLALLFPLDPEIPGKDLPPSTQGLPLGMGLRVATHQQGGFQDRMEQLRGIRIGGGSGQFLQKVPSFSEIGGGGGDSAKKSGHVAARGDGRIGFPRAEGRGTKIGEEASLKRTLVGDLALPSPP